MQARRKADDQQTRIERPETVDRSVMPIGMRGAVIGAKFGQPRTQGAIVFGTFEGCCHGVFPIEPADMRHR